MICRMRIKINTAKETNSRIQRAKLLRTAITIKSVDMRLKKEIAISAEKDAISAEREGLLKDIERMKAQIKGKRGQAHRDLTASLQIRLKSPNSEYKEKVATLDSDVKVADEYIDKEPVDTTI